MNTQATRLAHLPVTLFATVMGLAGLALAWRSAAVSLYVGDELHGPIAGLATLVYGLLILLYGIKALRFPEAVAREFAHPVKSNFFSAISISLILMAVLALDYSRHLAIGLFAFGAGLHLVLTMVTLSRWLFQHQQQNPHMNPAWFIPVVGNVLVPLAAVPLGQIEIAWFFFSIGLVFWLVLFTILMHRLFFLDPMPPPLAPTLFILIAPPAVGFLSYLKLNAQLDAFAQVMYGVALFLTLFLISQVHRFRDVPFFLSWWAYSFPLAAITIASMRYYELSQYGPVYMISVALLVLTSVVVVGLVLRTLVAIFRKQICIPE